MAAARKVYTWILALLGLIILGTVLVLSTVKSFFGVDWADQIEQADVEYYAARASNILPYNASATDTEVEIDGQSYIYEKVPRILHQTWKTDNLPEKWASFSAHCREMHPDYQYMLWTDASARSFIAEHYPWFLPTYEGYPYNIQRADVIRYFVLHKYGGVYLDLDIGCRKPVDPLLNFPALLPVTKPVGVSNDLMFSEPASPFMDAVIHNLMAFDHQYLSAYPTVMFSTGPMFLSAMLSLHRGVRLLPQTLYGKNIDPSLVPDSFFWHYYGSSWHANDSQIFTFLGLFGWKLLQIGGIVVALGALRLIWSYRATLLSKIWTPRAGPIALPEQDSLPSSRPHSRNASRSAAAGSPYPTPPNSAAPGGNANGASILIWVPQEELPRYFSDNLSLHSVKIDNLR